MLKEKNEQAIFVRYCALKNIPCVHIPNGFPVGNMRSKWAYINHLKEQGYSAGFPDLIVFAKNSKKDILFIEFKRVKGGQVSEAQKEWQAKLTEMGYDSYIAKGSKDAINILEDYLAR